jgi:cytochrome c oxidase subunit 4
MVIRHVTARQHLVTFVALVALATASLCIGIFLRVPFLAPAASLGIAAVKAVLVLMIFMHMAEHSFRVRLAVGVSVFLVLLLISLTAGDVATRQLTSRGPRPTADEAFYRR